MQRTLVILFLNLGLGTGSLSGQQSQGTAKGEAHRPTQKPAASASQECDCNHWPWPPSCKEVCGKITGTVTDVAGSNITLRANNKTYAISLPEDVKASSEPVASGDKVTILYRKQDDEKVATKLEMRSAGFGKNKKGK